MKRNYFNIIFLCLVMLSTSLFSDKGIQFIKGMTQSGEEEISIVIDPGHGGLDPGKVGINKALEKDINLKIAMKLKSKLEDKNINVIMTREDDNGLYKETDWDWKRVDMRNRVSIINSSDALFAVSIHQNSYSQENQRGAQVFYHQSSEKGKIIAETIQERIKIQINDGNHRQAKANGSFYMLRNTKCPLVIVECGFLSNWREASLLNDNTYQEKMAEAICMGIVEAIEIIRLE